MRRKEKGKSVRTPPWPFVQKTFSSDQFPFEEMVDERERFLQELMKAKQLPLIRGIWTLPRVNRRDADRLGEMLASQSEVHGECGLRSSGWLERTDTRGAETHKTDEDQQSDTDPQPDPLK
jgi:hypothetical protein